MALTIVGAVLLGLSLRLFTGFGFSLVVVPLLAIPMPLSIAALVAILCEGALSLLLAVDYRKDLRIADSFRLKAFSLIGATIARGMEPFIRLAWLAILAAVAIAAVAIVRFIKMSPTVLQRLGLHLPWIAGPLSGVLGYYTSASGPPIVLFFEARAEPLEDIRGRLAGYFVLLYTWLIVTHASNLLGLLRVQGSTLALAVATLVVAYWPLRRLDRIATAKNWISPTVRRRTGYAILLCSALGLAYEGVHLL
jgi:hypothetical protein